MLIYVNNNAAKNQAYFGGGLVSLLFLGVLWIISSGKLEWDGPIGLVLGASLVIWLFGSLLGGCVSLFKMSRFEGPIITFEPDGVTDYWSSVPTKYLWSDIRFIRWEVYQVTHIFEVRPKRFPIQQKLARLAGSMRLRYPSQYLSTFEASMSAFLLEYAPSEILK